MTGGKKVHPSCLRLSAGIHKLHISELGLLIFSQPFCRSSFDEESSLCLCLSLTRNEFQILILRYLHLPDDALVSSILMYCVWTRQIIWSIHPHIAVEELRGQ